MLHNRKYSSLMHTIKPLRGWVDPPVTGENTNHYTMRVCHEKSVNVDFTITSSGETSSKSTPNIIRKMAIKFTIKLIAIKKRHKDSLSHLAPCTRRCVHNQIIEGWRLGCYHKFPFLTQNIISTTQNRILKVCSFSAPAAITYYFSLSFSS